MYFMGSTFHNQSKIVLFHLLQVDRFFTAAFDPVAGSVASEKVPGYYVAHVTLDRYGPKVGPGNPALQSFFHLFSRHFWPPACMRITFAIF
jgi:hypothetical protein